MFAAYSDNVVYNIGVRPFAAHYHLGYGGYGHFFE